DRFTRNLPARLDLRAHALVAETPLLVLAVALLLRLDVGHFRKSLQAVREPVQASRMGCRGPCRYSWTAIPATTTSWPLSPPVATGACSRSRRSPPPPPRSP